MDWIKVIEIAEETISKQGINKSKLPEILGVNSQYLTDIRIKKKKSPGPEFALSLITKLNFNPIWLETCEGAIFNPPPPEKHPLVLELEVIVDQKLKRIEELTTENLKPLTERIETLERRLWNMNKPLSPINTKLFYNIEILENPIEMDSIFFLNNIAAGPFINQTENSDEYIEVPRHYLKAQPSEYYAVRIEGSSMTAAGIPDNSIVLIRSSKTPKDDTIQVVWHDGKTTLKRLRRDENNQWQLCYEDNTGRRIEIKPGEAYHILGDFVAVLSENKAVE